MSSTGFQLGEFSIDEYRPMKVVCIGAGNSGIIAALRYLEKVPNVELTIYEKEARIGGVWYNNIYPGVACDIPSHIYQIPWEPNSQWSSFYAPGAEIHAYLERVAAKHDLARFIKLQHELLAAQWDAADGKWRIRVRGPQGEMADAADVLLLCTGIVNRWAYPDIEGLKDFEGRVLHSADRAAWKEGTEGWEDKRVGVIGAGSSAIQIVPALQPKVRKVVNYVRGKTWICAPWGPPRLNELVGKDGNDEEYVFTDEDREKFKDPEHYRWFRRELEIAMSSAHPLMNPKSEMQEWARQFFEEDMKRKLAKKPEIAEHLIPQFAVGCRRLTPGPGYLKALCEDNVDFIPAEIKRATPKGLETVDGKHEELDIIVCATGFDVSYHYSYTVVGRNGVTLMDKFTPHPVTYLGVAVDEFPNMFMVGGPNAALTTSSFHTWLDKQVMFSVEATLKMQRERLKSLEVKKAAVEDFDEYLEAYFPGTVHSQKCRTWFKNGEAEGRIVALWPGSGLHGIRALSHPRWEDFDYERLGGVRNRFHWFGDGQTLNEKTISGDRVWYLEEYL